MILTLSIDQYNPYILLGTDTYRFSNGNIIQVTNPQWYISIFDLLENLKSNRIISTLEGYNEINLFPWENQCIIFPENTIFGKINIQWHGKQVQIIEINWYEWSVDITHCHIKYLKILEKFWNIHIEKDMSLGSITIEWSGSNVILKNLTIQDGIKILHSQKISIFSIDEVIFFSNVDKVANFDIYWSTINEFSLSNANLPETGLNISNSILQKIFFHKTNLEKLKLIWVMGKWFWNLIQGSNTPSEMKEFYRQLKHSHDEIWNKTEANKFFAKEMEYYMKALGWRTDFWKKLVSFINMCVNDYGNNWWLPIIWMSLITYYAAFYKFCYLQESGTFWWFFVKSILPISDIWNFNSFLDLLYKLTWAFLVYQFIIALRRISQR